MTMTLQDAIAEVRAIYARNEKYVPFDPSMSYDEIIFDAVASGDLIPKSEAGADLEHGLQTPQPGEVPASSAPALIPKADAEMAVALAYQRAGDMILNAGTRAHWLIRDDILALAPAEPLAEVEKLKALLQEARGDIAICVEEAWPKELRAIYPTLQAKWDCDMDLCFRIDAALKGDTP